jgi:hypothetical protein
MPADDLDGVPIELFLSELPRRSRGFHDEREPKFNQWIRIAPHEPAAPGGETL